MTMQRKLLFPIALLLALSTPAARAADSFDACAGTIASLPATLSTQGVWCLKADLGTVITWGAAITVAANNVTIDCNGFKIGGLGAGPVTSAYGIESHHLNTRVRNCHIRGFMDGVHLEGDSSVVADSIIEASSANGAFLRGAGHEIRSSRFIDIGRVAYNVTAVNLEGSLNFHDNVIDGVKSTGSSVWGISAMSGTVVVTDNTIQGLDGYPGYPTYGMVAAGARGFIEGNRVETLSGNGVAIYCMGPVIARNNSFIGFPATPNGCEDGGGNLFADVPPPP